MFEPFSHFLAYGSTDQQTLRGVTDAYDGLIVPGTIAAFQAEGTKGFVLTLSAAAKTPYAIDPRFPLFQSPRAQQKKSHGLLADILGLTQALGQDGWVRPDAWTPGLEAELGSRWISFNTAYQSGLQPKAFDKYARRLGRPIPSASQPDGPTWILPPYLVVEPGYPGAQEISSRLWDESVIAAERAGVRALLRRVLAVVDPELLPGMAYGSTESEFVVWVSNLDELDAANSARLASYARAIRMLSESGKRPFGLYGGYFAVALRSVGLTGASHGVGFSEFRNYIELKSSGAAPARFYVARAHRFFPRDLASELWRRDPGLVDGLYADYTDRDPLEYGYHELMRHSVLARKAEIDRSAALSIGDHIEDLLATYGTLRAELAAVRLTEGLRRRSENLLVHLPMWSSALRASL